MSNLVKLDLLILDSNGIAIKNINIRTKYVNGSSFHDEKTDNFGYREVTVSENRNFEIYVENPEGEMEYNKTLNSKSAIKQVHIISIKKPISAYSTKRHGSLKKIKIKLIDIEGSILKNFPVRTGYKGSSRFLEKTTDDKGMLEFQASSNRLIEVKSIDLNDNFVPIGYFNSNETKLVNVKHKFKIEQFLSKITVKIVDIDGSHIYPNAKIKITYNGNLGIKIIKNGLLNIATYVGYPIELTIYKPDNTPLQEKIYVASRMKPASGFEIRVPVNITRATTNINKPNSTQEAPSGLNSFISSCIPLHTGEKITENDYLNAAKELNCEVAAIKAVAQTESPRGAFQDFLGKKMPSILYERHIFRKLTGGKYSNNYPVLSGDRGNYGKYNVQYKKLLEAMGLSEDAALQSCSWGKFQILGANYKNCGYTNVKDMIKDEFISEKIQLKHFVSFIKYDRQLLNAIQERKWTNFAKGYNGPKYYENSYDTKMAQAYEIFKKNPNKMP